MFKFEYLSSMDVRKYQGFQNQLVDLQLLTMLDSDTMQHVAHMLINMLIASHIISNTTC